MDTNNELHEGEYAEDAERVARSYSEPLQGQFVLDVFPLESSQRLRQVLRCC